MQPNMIYRDRLYIKGITGSGANTGKVWDDFEKQYENNPFEKQDNNGYELRFYDGEEKTVGEQDLHVGFCAGNSEASGFSILELPATEYAVFDVLVAKGYDSENAAMDQWLADNASRYGQRELDGKKFVIECYNDKFKGGDKPDSMVEIWSPVYRICQSCSMPMTQTRDFGTEEDKSQSTDYCCHCYGNGSFFKEETMDEMIESCIPFCADYYGSAEHARQVMQKTFPRLKRWSNKIG